MNKRAFHTVLITLLVLVTVSFSLGATGTKEEKPAAKSGSLMEGELGSGTIPTVPAAQAPESTDGSLQFLTIDIYGQRVDASVFSDKEVTLINVWGTYCPPCIQEMPFLGELNREYADRGFQIVGIVIDGYHQDEAKFKEQLGMARAIADYTKADYPHLLPVSIELNEAYLSNIQVVPTTFFVDSKGNLIGEEVTGSRSKADWIKIIDEVLAEYAD